MERRVKEQSRNAQRNISRCATETAMNAGLAQQRSCTFMLYFHLALKTFNQSIADLPGAFHAMSTPAVHLHLR